MEIYTQVVRYTKVYTINFKASNLTPIISRIIQNLAEAFSQGLLPLRHLVVDTVFPLQSE